MASPLARARAVHERPEQAEFWRRETVEAAPPVDLPRDFLGGDRELSASVEARLSTADALARLTHGDPTLRAVFAAAVTALVAARAADVDRVRLLTARPDGRSFPLSVDVGACRTVRDLLSGTRAAYAAAAPNADIPVAFVLAERSARVGDFAAFSQAEPDETETAGTTLAFTLTADSVRLRYAGGLFSRATAQRLLASFVRLAAQDIDTEIAPLRAADDAEAAFLDACNATAAAVPPGTLHGFLEEAAARQPDRVAIRDGEVTYVDLNQRANRLARALIACGVQRGDAVGVRLPRSVSEVVALHAVLKTGAAYLPIDPTTPPGRLRHVLAVGGVKVLVDDGGDRMSYPDGCTVVDATDESCLADDDRNIDAAVGPDDIAYVIFTSGSTGLPKGVEISHRAIVNRVAWMQRAYPVEADDVILHKTSFTFDVSVWELFWWALAGASVSVLPAGEERDPERLTARIAEHRVSVMHFVPSMLAPFLRHTEALGAAGRLASLRTVFCSGEELRPSHVTRFRSLVGGTRLVNLYGPTEAAVDVTHFDCAAADISCPVPIGRPIDNIRLCVTTRAGLPAPIGVPGELVIAGTGVARGYRNAPELTAAAFEADPGHPGGLRYRSGDLARWLPDGNLEFLGRRDRQVKVRGQRVEPAEVEHALAAVPGVADCAVVAEPDDDSGHRLVAYVVIGRATAPEEIRAALAARLPAVLVPAAVLAVAAIPTTGNGKRDLTALAALAVQPARRRTPPGTAIGRRLAAVWESVLGVASVGEEDTFFDLGGDSITAIDVLIAARAAGLPMTYQELFTHSTLNDLAHLLADPARACGVREAGAPEPFALVRPSDRALLPGDAVDAYPLSSLQSGLLYETTLAAGRGLYHDVVSYLTADRIDADRLCRAVAAVAARHPALRTTFHLTGFSEPLQIVHAEASALVRIADLASLTETEQDAELDALRRHELVAGFRVDDAAPVRVWLHRLGERGTCYTLSYHAAALDGWSVSILNRDIFVAYHTDVRPRATAGSTGFAAYLRDEREAVESPEHRDYWTAALEGGHATRLPRLPFEAPAAEHDLAVVAIREVDLPAAVAERIPVVATRLGVPVKSVLLGAHMAVLGYVGGTDDVLTGYEHSGRPEAVGADGLLGLFLNTVPLRVDLAACRTWADVVRAVFEAEAALLPHRRFPYADLIRLGTSAAAPDAIFNFTHFRVLKDLVRAHDFTLTRAAFVSQTGFPFRAEFWQDPYTDEVGLALHYHRQEFAADQIDGIAGYYLRALEALTIDPQAEHCRATLMGEAELARLTDEFAGPARELPDATALDLFMDQVRRSPKAVAVGDGAADLDYATLAARVHGFAALLHRRGVRRGDVVAVTMPRGLHTVVAVLAVLRLGAVYLPQDLGDPVLRRRDMLQRSGCRFAVAAPADATALAAELAGTHTSVLTFEDQPAAALDEVPLPRPSDPAYVIFTSGSTGRPKGAMIHHRGLLNHLLAKVDDLALGADAVIAQAASQCFDISVWQLLAALLVGGRTEIFTDVVVADLAAFADRAAGSGVTVLEVVPAYLDALLAEVEARPRPLPALRHLMVTGERLPPALTGRWFAAYPAPMVNAYGPTEASDDVTHHVLRAPVRGERVPVGRPINNTRLHVVDVHGRRCPIGTFGEVVVTGAGVGLGYVAAPDQTAKVFVPNVFDTASATAYRTGDMGRWLPDGTLDCAGRRDEQVKLRGLRIELSEVEVAAAGLPGIERAVALVRRDGGGERLVLVHTGPDDLDPASARRELARRLPVAMLPDAFVRLDDLPVSRNGKLDRKALTDLPLAPPVAAARAAPADASEAEILAVFAEVLDMPKDAIGVLDNFFAVGGHSLAALKVVSRLAGKVSLADLVAAPTARSLARRGHRHSPLVDLGEAAGRRSGRAAAIVVCVPFAGGTAVSSVPLAAALADRAVAVFGVEPDAAALEGLAARVADEIGLAATERAGGEPGTRIVLVGHSSGAALAFLIALNLRRAGLDPHLVVVAHHVPESAEPDPATDAEIAALAGPGTLDLAGFVTRYRHDAAESRRVLTAAAARPCDYRPASPATLILAADDPVAPSDLAAAERWSPLTDGLRVVVAETGGHYLATTRPELIADCVLAAASIEAVR